MRRKNPRNTRLLSLEIEIFSAALLLKNLLFIHNLLISLWYFEDGRLLVNSDPTWLWVHLIRNGDLGHRVAQRCAKYVLVWKGMVSLGWRVNFSKRFFEKYQLYCVAVAGGGHALSNFCGWAPLQGRSTPNTKKNNFLDNPNFLCLLISRIAKKLPKNRVAFFRSTSLKLSTKGSGNRSMTKLWLKHSRTKRRTESPVQELKLPDQ